MRKHFFQTLSPVYQVFDGVAKAFQGARKKCPYPAFSISMLSSFKGLNCSVVALFLMSCGVEENLHSRPFAAESLVEQDLIQRTLSAANQSYSENQTLYSRSVAQVVFPKIFKAGLMLGGSYGEGFLVRDGIILSKVRHVGGTAGVKAGIQSYSKIVYILDEDTLASFRQGRKLSLHGTLNYSSRGRSISSLFGKLSPTAPLYTTIFNQSGYLAGVSLDGTIMEIML